MNRRVGDRVTRHLFEIAEDLLRTRFRTALATELPLGYLTCNWNS